MLYFRYSILLQNSSMTESRNGGENHPFTQPLVSAETKKLQDTTVSSVETPISDEIEKVIQVLSYY